jgi:hypothetical protein
MALITTVILLQKGNASVTAAYELERTLTDYVNGAHEDRSARATGQPLVPFADLATMDGTRVNAHTTRALVLRAAKRPGIGVA